MEIEKSYFQKVKSYIESANKNSNMELEVRFWNPNEEKMEIHENHFKKIFDYYTFQKENDGLGCAYTMVSSLDICVSYEGNNYASMLDRTRLTIEDANQIKKYWLQNNLQNIEYKMIEKKKMEKLDIQEYFLRVSLQEEIPESEIYQKNKNQLLNHVNQNNEGNGNRNSTLLKNFRLKNRYQIITPDKLFQIDLTSVKSNSGKTFREAHVLKAHANYEIEIEYIGNKRKDVELNSEEVCVKLFEHVHTILSIMNDSDFILKQSIKSAVLHSYHSLIQLQNRESSGYSYSNEFKPEFICANPVTIHRSNLIKSSTENNLYNHYSVSLKADGMRMCAFTLSSPKPELNGAIYFIDINDNIIYSGYKDESYVNTLVEGEYVKELGTGKYVFYAYDILFERGNDVRRRQYYNTFKEERLLSRSVYVDRFVKSSSRMATLEQVVEIKRKGYKVSEKADGSDIFEKAHELWESRTSQPFYVDGLIFTPNKEHYPLRSGSWYSLFKWKPPHLNTIDFLIDVVKNSLKSEMKFPYLDSVLKEDGTIESVVKQYKKIKLNVGTFRDAFNERNRKMTKRKFKTLFAPYGLNDEGSEAYHTCHVFVDENDNMICEDPISGEKEIMHDDTIVEFGFDPSREKGFQWVPYRVRHDKTLSYQNGRHVYGNLDKTAYDIFRSLQYPVTEEMITTGKNIPLRSDGTALNAPSYYANILNENVNHEREPYQNFHNHHIKMSLLREANPRNGQSGVSGKIFDICCGKGMDIKRIKPAMYAEVVGMDYDLENIKLAQKYYDSAMSKPKPKAYYVRGDAGKLIFPNQDAGLTESDKIQLRKYIPTKYIFDVMSVQFAIHYFFESEVRLRSFLQNVNDNLKIGGLFIGTCFDGERVHQMLKGVNEVEGKRQNGTETLWKIQKKYSTTRMSWDASKPNFGKEIDVFVKSIGNVHTEYLVNFNYLDAILQEYGFEKVMVKPFGTYYEELLKSEYNEEKNSPEHAKNVRTAKEMSVEEQRFSFLNNAFMYKKVSNTSDALFKKLVRMIEDQVKREKKKTALNEEQVEVLDNETAHLVTSVAEVEDEAEPEDKVEPEAEAEEILGGKKIMKRVKKSVTKRIKK